MRHEFAMADGPGGFQEAHMQPDMPNLVAGLVVYGWLPIVIGVLVGRRIAKTESRAA